MRINRLLLASSVLAFLAACGGNKTAETPRDPNAPAGDVVAIEGDVTAKRASATTSRALAIDGDVFADDDVTTAAAATVQIRLAHNGAVWTIGESKTMRVDASAAWTAPKQSDADLVFKREDREDLTRAAARSGSQEGISSGEAALEVSSVHRGEEGQMGKREVKSTSASEYQVPHPAMAMPVPPPQPDPSGPKNENEKILRALGAQNDGLLSPDKSLSQSIADQTGSSSSSEGMGGLGLKGSGLGGGGADEGDIGLGNIGTIGKGAGGSGSGYGSGSGSMGRDGGTKVSLAGVTVMPTDREALVKKVVQQNFAQIRYCIESGWTKNPRLAGRVTVKFVVGPDGTVTSSAIKSVTGSIDSTTQSCMTSRFLRWQFPKFTDGITIAEASFLAAIEGEEPAATAAPAATSTPTAP